jgi:O-antigen/teichoic acid export membrane protein
MTLLRYGAPLYVAVLLGGLAQPYQTIILANFALDKDVGNLQVAQNFLSLLSVLPAPIVAALLPAFAKLDSSTTQKIKTFFKAATKYATMLVIPITILMMTYSGEIVHVIYPSYQTAGLLLATYCLLYFLVGLGYLTLGSLYNGLGDTKSTLIITLIGFVTIIVLSPVLTQAYSVQGMIAASIIASTAGTIYGALKARRKYEIEFDMRSILKIYLNALASIVLPILLLYSGVIPAAVKPIIPSFLLHRLTFLPELIDLAIGATLYILTYLTLTPLTRAMTATELETVAHITKKTKLLAFIAKPFLKYQQMIIHLTTK